MKNALLKLIPLRSATPAETTEYITCPDGTIIKKVTFHNVF